MPSDKPARRIQDILDNIRAVKEYTSGVGLEEYLLDHKTRDAVERCLERICEAAAKLGDAAQMLMPDQPWRDIRALGNRLRHEYDEIDQRIWETIQTGLPAPEKGCLAALSRHET